MENSAVPQTYQNTQSYNQTANKSIKAEKSADFFKTTRVDSCTHVVVKNGVAQAVPFRPDPPKEASKPINSQTLYQYIYCFENKVLIFL